MIDLAAYLARIGLEATPAADANGLAELVLAQRLSIPFENLDIPLGRGISLAPDAVFGKLVTRRRGGYCFEQNQLLLNVLHRIGFAARPLTARVWLQADGIPPRTHTLNLVTIAGEAWIADAGFGGAFVPPILLGDGETRETDDSAAHRLRVDAEHGWMLERDAGQGFQPQYSFTLEAVAPVDLEVGNHWTSTRPNTRFTTIRAASIARRQGAAGLLDRTLTLHHRGVAEPRLIENAAEYRQVLAELFGIDLNEDEVSRLGLF